MFNQHHTHYTSSSKIIPCSCKGNVITSKSWETQWHECIDRKNKVCSRYLIFIWVWMFTTITSRALHIYEVRKTTPSESFSALLPQHCPGLKRCPQLPSVFKCENNSSWTTYVMNNTPDTPKQPYLTSWEGEHQRLSACKQTVCTKT